MGEARVVGMGYEMGGEDVDAGEEALVLLRWLVVEPAPVLRCLSLMMLNQSLRRRRRSTTLMRKSWRLEAWEEVQVW